MHAFLIPLLKGLLAVYAIVGMGRLALRFAQIRDIPWYWNLGFTVLAGQAAVNVIVQLVLLSGAGSPPNLRIVVWLLLGVATAGFLSSSWTGNGKTIREVFQANKAGTAILLLAVLTNFVVALAPSTKMDELYYHMLTPKRIVEDGGLKLYLLPVEAAIVPHMQYQISLSIAHAAGAPDAGNFLSCGFSFALLLFMAGFLADATANRRLAVLCVALCSVGVYATVWHTSSGAHALGDLATVVALAGVLLPETLLRHVSPARFTLLLVGAAALAATTKISLLPLSIVASALIVLQASRAAAAERGVAKLAALAILPWGIFHLPLMIWTFRVSGSPWGPFLANVFAPSIFPANILKYANDLQVFNPGDIVPMIRYAVIELSPVFLVAILWLIWTAVRGSRISRMVVALLLLQGGLVAWKFHFDFRFLGGLEYVAVLAAVLTIAKREDARGNRVERAAVGNRVAKFGGWIMLFAAVPWLASQIYYALPFAGVVSGFAPRDQFVERYVALTVDFQKLDGILPKDAVLYLPDWRIPNFYVPRQVVLTPLDLHGRASVYKLTASPESDAEEIDATSILKCGETVYANDHAVVEAYRAPGRVPMIGQIVVKGCEIQNVGEKK